MGRRPLNEYAVLAASANAQLRRAKLVGRSLDERLKAKLKAADDFVLDEEFRRDFASITATIRDCGAALVRARDASKKDYGELSEAQLSAQWSAELVKAAQELSDEDWQKMCASRAKAGR